MNRHCFMAINKNKYFSFMKIAQANDIYVDYLIIQNGQSTATGCSKLINNDVKHDVFTCMLFAREYDSKFVWEENKTAIREV